MPSSEELVPVADASAFIFTGSVARAGTSPVSGDTSAVVVSVEEVIKSPVGLRGLVGREVTVQLQHPIREGQYVFFADPVSIGAGITVKELAHFNAEERAHAAQAVERGYALLIEARAQAAFLVALGTIGEVRPLLTPAERFGRVSWALAGLETERVLKGRKPRRVTLVGPNPGSKRLMRTPTLREGLRAVLFLQRPPQEALELIPEAERQEVGYLADTSDIQPPERLETIAQIVGRAV